MAISYSVSKNLTTITVRLRNVDNSDGTYTTNQRRGFESFDLTGSGYVAADLAGAVVLLNISARTSSPLIEMFMGTSSDNWGPTLTATAADHDSTATYSEDEVRITSTGQYSWGLDKNHLDLNGINYFSFRSNGDPDDVDGLGTFDIMFSSLENTTAANRPILRLYLARKLTITDTVTIVEIFRRNIHRSLIETLIMIEKFIRRRIFVDFFLINDTLNKKPRKTVIEGVSLIEIIQRKTVRIITDTATVTDDLLAKPKKVLLDSITLIATILRRTTVRLSEVLGLNDILVRVVVKRLSEVILVVERFIRGRQFVNTLTILDTIFRGPRKVLLDTLSAIDRLRMAINGIWTALWARQNKDQDDEGWRRVRKDL